MSSNKRIIDLPSGSINDNELVFVGDPVTGALSQLSYGQMRNALQAGMVTASQYTAFSGSYVQDSASFVGSINTIANNEGKYTLSSSFNSYTSSNNAAVAIVYSSQSNYVPTASFLVISASYYNDSSSNATKIASHQAQILNVFASESNYQPTASFLVISASYFNDSSSNATKFATQSTLVTNAYASQSNFETTASFLTFQTANQTQITNVFASESNYTPSGSYNASQTAYALDSASFNGKTLTVSNGLNSLSGSYVIDSSSFNNRIISNTGNITALQVSQSTYVPTASFNVISASYYTDSGSNATKFINNSANIATNAANITNVYASQSLYETVAAYQVDSSSFNRQIANVYASESLYTPLTGFNTLSSSYSVDSGSFNSRINTHTTQIANVFASQSSFETIANYQIDSASFLAKIAAVTGSGGSTNTGSLLPTASFQAYTASVQIVSQSLVDASTTVWNVTSGSVAKWTIGGNNVLSVVSASILSAGILLLTQDTTGSRVPTLPGKTPTGMTFSNNTGSQDLLGYFFDGVNFFWSITNYGNTLPLLTTPANFSASLQGATAVSLSWNAVSNATNYILQSSTAADYSANLLTLSSGSNLNFADTNLSQSTNYYFRVEASASGFATSGFALTSSFTVFNFNTSSMNFLPRTATMTSQSGIWSGSNAGTYTNFGLGYNGVGALRLTSGSDGFIAMTIGATGFDAILAFNSEPVSESYTSNKYQAAVFIPGTARTQLNYISGSVINGIAAVAPSIGQFIRIRRSGSNTGTATYFAESSPDFITWANLYQFSGSNTGSVFPEIAMNTTSSIYFPVQQGLI